MVIGEQFVRERMVLGGRRYERCIFVDCELVLDGQPVHLVGNSFEGCVWSFEGAAGVTLDVLSVLCRGDRALRTRIGRELGLPAGQTRPAVAGPVQRRDRH